jgi:hypothetical protein
MNRSIRVTVASGRVAWPRPVRVAAAVAAAAALAAPAVASAGSQTTAVQQALAFSRCMRSHGVPKFPDPTSSGAIPKESLQQLGVSSSQLQAAQRACQRLLPNGGQPTPAALQRSWSNFLRFAQCMRRHGVESWPDPTRYPRHPDRPYFDLQRAGIDPNAPKITTEIRACLPLLHGTNPQHLGAGGS